MSDASNASERIDLDPRPGHGAAPFVAAVVSQLSRGIENAGSGAQQRVDWLTDRLTGILLRLERGESQEVVDALIEDPLLLSSIFQNTDLLYEHEYPFADRLSMITLDAVHRAVEADDAG